MASYASEGSRAFDLEEAVLTLERGQALMIQLQWLIWHQLPEHGDTLDLCRSLVDGISGSLSLCLTALRSCEQSRGKLNTEVQMNVPSRYPEAEGKEVAQRSGGYSSKKRRRTTKEETTIRARSRTTITAAPYHDGLLWRKYGQKEIRGSKHPRSYYRCAYSNEFACPATKKVQQTDNDDLPTYLVTYTNKHTCNGEQSAALRPTLTLSPSLPLSPLSLPSTPPLFSPLSPSLLSSPLPNTSSLVSLSPPLPSSSSAMPVPSPLPPSSSPLLQSPPPSLLSSSLNYTKLDDYTMLDDSSIFLTSEDMEYIQKNFTGFS